MAGLQKFTGRLRRAAQRSLFLIIYIIRLLFGRSVVKMNFRFFSKLTSASDMLRLLDATVGARARISSDICVYNLQKHSCRNLRIGSNVFIGPGCLFDLNSQITLEDDVSISPRVSFITHLDVGHQPLQKMFPKKEGSITVKRGVWIGVNSTVLHGVTIGGFAMVGAMSLINKDIPPGSLSVGIPCKVIRRFACPGPADLDSPNAS